VRLIVQSLPHFYNRECNAFQVWGLRRPGQRAMAEIRLTQPRFQRGPLPRPIATKTAKESYILYRC
jgi:hypothetical protein